MFLRALSLEVQRGNQIVKLGIYFTFIYMTVALFKVSVHLLMKCMHGKFAFQMNSFQSNNISEIIAFLPVQIFMDCCMWFNPGNTVC